MPTPTGSGIALMDFDHNSKYSMIVKVESRYFKFRAKS
jgi:hypothetical protein